MKIQSKTINYADSLSSSLASVKGHEKGNSKMQNMNNSKQLQDEPIQLTDENSVGPDPHELRTQLILCEEDTEQPILIKTTRSKDVSELKLTN